MRPAHRAHQAPDVVDMVSHAEVALDDLSDSRAGPQIGLPSVGAGPLSQKRDKLTALLFAQAWGPPRAWPSPQGVESLLVSRIDPAID